MKEEQHQFLTLVGQPPARLNVEQVAWLLGCQPHDVPVLVAAKFIKPLGNPPQNGTKFFATAEIVEQMKERNWLARMSNAISQHWHKKNKRHKQITADNLSISEPNEASVNGFAPGCADECN